MVEGAERARVDARRFAVVRDPPLATERAAPRVAAKAFARRAANAAWFPRDARGTAPAMGSTMAHRAFALTSIVLVSALGCSATPSTPEHHDEGEGSPGEPTASTSQASTTITRSEAIANAMQWVNARLQYCQAAYGAHDYDTACSPVCNRQSNTLWNPYRSDCSGFISWAWQLPAPGRVTSQFAPFNTAVSSTINCVDMKPGDAANKTAGGHIVLFKSWVTPGHEAIFLEEPGCSSSTPYAHEFQSTVTCSGVNVFITYEGESFTAIRYDSIVDDPVDAGTHTSDAGTHTSDAGTHADAAAHDAGGTPSVDSGSSVGSGDSGSASDAGASGEAPSGSGDGTTPAWNGAGAASGCDVAPGSTRGGCAGALALLGLALLARRRRSAKGCAPTRRDATFEG